MLLVNSVFNDEAPKGWMPWGLFAPILGLVFVVIAMLPSELLLPRWGWIDDQGDFVGFDGFVIFMLFAFPLMGVIVLAWTKWIERRPFSSIGLSANKWRSTFAWGILVGVGSSLLVIMSIAMVGGYETGNWFVGLTSLSNFSGVMILLACFAIQSSVEELLFRGWLFSVVTRKFNVLAAFIASGLLFTLLHLTTEDPWYVNLNSFMFSVFACYLVLYSNNVWLAMGWHAGWNWFIGVGFDIPLTGIDIEIDALVVQMKDVGEPLITGGAGGPESSLSCFIFFLLASVVLHFLCAKQRKESDKT